MQMICSKNGMWHGRPARGVPVARKLDRSCVDWSSSFSLLALCQISRAGRRDHRAPQLCQFRNLGPTTLSRKGANRLWRRHPRFNNFGALPIRGSPYKLEKLKGNESEAEKCLIRSDCTHCGDGQLGPCSKRSWIRKFRSESRLANRSSVSRAGKKDAHSWHRSSRGGGKAEWQR